MSAARDKGLELFKKLHGGHSGEEIVRAFEKLSPKMLQMTLEWVFGDLMQTKTLDLKTKEWIILACLITQGHWPNVKAHVEAALHAGATKEEIVEMMNLTAIYAGFPAAANALLAAKEVLEKH